MDRMDTQWGPRIGATKIPSQPAPRRRGKPFFKRKQFLIAGVVLAGILGYLIYMGVQSAMMYYMSVSELLAKGDSVYAQSVRVTGKVVEGSIQEDPANMTIRFVVADEQNSLPVVYKGVVPDAFKPGAEVVLEGTLTPSGTFEATSLLAKCPSKYNPLGGN